MASLRQIFPFINDVFAALLELDLPSVNILKSEIQGPGSLDVDQERCARIGKFIKTDGETVAVILSTLDFLYSNVHGRSGDLSIEQRISAVVEQYSVINDETQKQSLIERLALLLEKSDAVDNYLKVIRLKIGFLDNASGFSSFVDLRPVFSEDRLSINGVVPIVQFKISLDDNAGSEKSVVFQLDDKSLKKLKEAVDAVERKMDTLNKSGDLIKLADGNP